MSYCAACPCCSRALGVVIIFSLVGWGLAPPSLVITPYIVLEFGLEVCLLLRWGDMIWSELWFGRCSAGRILHRSTDYRCSLLLRWSMLFGACLHGRRESSALLRVLRFLSYSCLSCCAACPCCSRALRVVIIFSLVPQNYKKVLTYARMYWHFMLKCLYILR